MLGDLSYITNLPFCVAKLLHITYMKVYTAILTKDLGYTALRKGFHSHLVNTYFFLFNSTEIQQENLHIFENFSGEKYSFISNRLKNTQGLSLNWPWMLKPSVFLDVVRVSVVEAAVWKARLWMMNQPIVSEQFTCIQRLYPSIL